MNVFKHSYALKCLNVGLFFFWVFKHSYPLKCFRPSHAHTLWMPFHTAPRSLHTVVKGVVKSVESKMPFYTAPRHHWLTSEIVCFCFLFCAGWLLRIFLKRHTAPRRLADFWEFLASSGDSNDSAVCFFTTSGTDSHKYSRQCFCIVNVFGHWLWRSERWLTTVAFKVEYSQ